MPNYSLTINSRFRPFSYQEMLAPVLQQTQAHQQIEESYATLAAEADQWKNIALSEPDSQAAARYIQYSKDLENQANILATNGLSLNSRKDAFKMAQRYQSEMLPIQQAYTTKMKDIEAQRAAGPDAVFSYDANTRSIDRYIENPMQSYETLDLNKAFTAAAGDISQIKGALTELKTNGRIDQFHKYYQQIKGLTPAEAGALSQAMSTNDWSNIDLTKPQNQFVYSAMNRVYNSYVQPWMDNAQKQKLTDYIARGAAYGIGTQDIKEYQDVAAIENYKARKAKEEEIKNAFRSRTLELKPGQSETTKESLKITRDYKKFKEYQDFLKKYPEFLTTKKDFETKQDLQTRLNALQMGQAIGSRVGKEVDDAIEKAELQTKIENYDFYNKGYKIAEEYKDLEEKLRKIAAKNNPSGTSYSNYTINNGTVIFDDSLNDAVKKIARIESGYTFHVASEKPLLNELRKNMGNDTLKNEYLINQRGNFVKTSTLFPSDLKKQKELWDNASLDIEGGNVRLHIGNNVYTVMPGAFGATIDEGIIDPRTGIQVSKPRKEIIDLYNRGDYQTFAEEINNWADNAYIWSNSVLPEQTTSVQDITPIVKNW